MAGLLLAQHRRWEPGQGKQLILFQNRDLHINKCLVTDAFFSLLALLSSFSCPSFLSPGWKAGCPLRELRNAWNRGWMQKC